MRRLSPHGRMLGIALGSCLALSVSAGAEVVVVQSFGVTGGTPGPADNDFTRIQDALLSAESGDEIQLEGTFDLGTGAALDAYRATAHNYITPVTAHGFLPPLFRYVDSGGSTVEAGVENVTLTSHANGSEIAMPGLSELASSTSAHFLFVHPSGGTAAHNQVQSRNFTIDGLTVTGPLEGITGTWESHSARMNGLSVLNSEFTLGSWRGSSAGFRLRFQDQDITIDGNTFNLVANSAPGPDIGRLLEVISMPASSQVGGHDNLSFSNNTINGVIDDTLRGQEGRPADPWPTTYVIAVNENSNSRDTNMTFDGNTFNGLAEEGGQQYRTIALAYMPTTRPGQFFVDGPRPTSITFADNTFIGVMSAWHCRNPDLVTDPGHGDYTQKGGNTWYFPGATFENCGWQKELYTNPMFAAFSNPGASQRPQSPPDFSEITDPDILDNALVIRNYHFAFGGTSPSNVFFDINLEVDGHSGVDALNFIASRPLFFESSDPLAIQGFGDYLPEQNGAGILPEVETPALDESWTGLPKWTDPIGGNSGLAIGYNAFGGTPDIGDPDFFANDPRSVIEMPLAPESLTEFAPGTRINKRVVLHTDESGKAAGAGAAVISATVGSAANPLFLLEENGELVLDNVILTGNVDGTAGERNLPNAVRIPSGHGNATLEATNVTFTNFSTQILQGTGADTLFTVSDSLLTNSGGVIVANNGSGGLNLSDSLVTNISSTLFTIQDADLELRGSHFRHNPGNTLFVISHGDRFVIGGTPDDGNVFWDGFRANINMPGGVYGRPATYVFTANWHADLFDPLPGSDGLSSAPHAYASSPSDDFGPDSYIAWFDTDLDGLPDFIELRSGSTSFDTFDSAGNGFPDGAEALPGFDPGDFDLAAATNPRGIVDWYLDALEFHGADGSTPGTSHTLGDINRTGSVTLGDAIRALQVINGTLPFTMESGNMNALRVTGGPANSLANPLQILRFQAGVRLAVPAVAGID